jgi:hypothetical protein
MQEMSAPHAGHGKQSWPIEAGDHRQLGNHTEGGSGARISMVATVWLCPV